MSTDPVAGYNELVGRNPPAALEQAAWLEDAFARAGITFGGAPMRAFLRPHFVTRDSWNELRDTGRRILETAARVARQAFGGDVARLCAWLGTPEAEARWVAADPGEPDVVLSRLDAFLTPEGPRFIEINSDAPAGFGYGDRMAEVFRELPVFREFARSAPVSYLPSGPRLVEAVLGLWRRRGGTGAPFVVIADWADVKTRSDQEILRQAFEAAGVRCALADPTGLELRGGRLLAGGEAVDVVYRRGVLSELVAREGEVRAFLEAYRDGAALFVNSFRCRISEDKAFFGLLTDEAFAELLSPDERALVARFVPWTRKLDERRTLKAGREVDLVPYVLRERERLVLKPAHGYGGQSVFVGDETRPSDWEAAVREGLGKPWVVQERVTIPEEAFPVCDGGRLAFEALKVNANPFYVAGAEVGAVTRASRSSVINVSAGGGSVPTFVVG
ncbi:MAG: circularly permuted type 2 ATP-grasp protein [Acidobacteria bacterium]|nr:circularly permuted type 2 ATP-grasp protein [Acidobacteriota bacterium]